AFVRVRREVMGSAKAWYFTALGVVALSLGSSTGRCVFDQVSGAVDQFRAKTMPYVAMLEMTIGHSRNSTPAQHTSARLQETAAQLGAEQACAEAAIARVEAAKARLEAERATRAEEKSDAGEPCGDIGQGLESGHEVVGTSCEDHSQPGDR